VAAALGRPNGPTPSDLTLPDAPSYVVFLVDGLGARMVDRHREAAPFLAALHDDNETGTAGDPSTTATRSGGRSLRSVPGDGGSVLRI
jgi:hypothetical protein